MRMLQRLLSRMPVICPQMLSRMLTGGRWECPLDLQQMPAIKHVACCPTESPTNAQRECPIKCQMSARCPRKCLWKDARRMPADGQQMPTEMPARCPPGARHWPAVCPPNPDGNARSNAQIPPNSHETALASVTSHKDRFFMVLIIYGHIRGW